MDEKHLTQGARGVSAAKSVQPQPTRTDTATVLPKNGVVNLGSEKSGVTDSSTPKLEGTKQAGDLTVVLQASRAELDKLLSETQTIHERSWRVIHSLLEDSQLRASQAVDACLARFEKDIQDRISSEMAITLQNFDVEAGARMAARLDQGLAAAKQRQRSIEQDLAVAVAENRKQLDQISTGAADGLRQREQSLVGELQREAEKQLSELAKSASQITNNVQRVGETVGAELKVRTDEALQTFQSRLEQVWQEIVERAEKRIADAAHASTVELARQARQVVDREMSEFFSNALRRFDRSGDAQSSEQK